VRVDNWDVLLVDSGSRNGTLVAPPGQNQWARLAPRQSHRLVPGTRIRIGGRTLVFESPSGVS
jgi:FHA domain